MAGVMAHVVGKYMESKKAWLYSDAHDEALVAGNREGLEQLSLAIQRALELYGNRIPTEVETTDVSFVLCIEQEEYFKNDSKPETFHQKIVRYSLMVWFLLLPFVGLAALIFLVAYSIRNIF
jgi:flagellar biosynthesis/type III secretory pathway M-ring protein FliF/YscJ